MRETAKLGIQCCYLGLFPLNLSHNSETSNPLCCQISLSKIEHRTSKGHKIEGSVTGKPLKKTELVRRTADLTRLPLSTDSRPYFSVSLSWFSSFEQAPSPRRSLFTVRIGSQTCCLCLKCLKWLNEVKRVRDVSKWVVSITC